MCFYILLLNFCKKVNNESYEYLKACAKNCHNNLKDFNAIILGYYVQLDNVYLFNIILAKLYLTPIEYKWLESHVKQLL